MNDKLMVAQNAKIRKRLVVMLCEHFLSGCEFMFLAVTDCDDFSGSEAVSPLELYLLNRCFSACTLKDSP